MTVVAFTPRNASLRALIDRARRAQMEAAGGHAQVERNERALDRMAEPPASKTLTAGQIMEARRLRAAGWSWLALGRRYGVDHTTVAYHADDELRARRNERRRRREAA